MTNHTQPAAPVLRRIALDGLWTHNAGFVRLLGLCPLLAVTTTVVNGVALGLATLLVISASNVLVSLLRPLLRAELRIAVFVLLIATLVTAIDLGLQAWFFDVHKSLGIFVPLIVTNCAIVERAERFASHHGLAPSLVDGLATGTGFAAALVTMGALRELAGHGTLLRDAQLLFGEAARDWQISLPAFDGFLPVLLPPGAFISLALIVAARNALTLRGTRRRAATTASAAG